MCIHHLQVGGVLRSKKKEEFLKSKTSVFNKVSKSLGFTLAEVLVTIAVLGVIFALVVPSLQKSYQKSQWIAGYKQAYSIINQATKMVIADNGGSLQGAWSNKQEMLDAYKPHLNM